MSTTSSATSDLSSAISQVRADLAGTAARVLAPGAEYPGNDLVDAQLDAGWDSGSATVVFNVKPKDPTQNVWLSLPGFTSPDQTTVYASALFVDNVAADVEGQNPAGIFQTQQFTQSGLEVTGIISGYVTSTSSAFNLFQFQKNFTIG